MVFDIPEIALKIFSYVPVLDLYNLRYVCAQWKAYADEISKVKFLQIESALVVNRIELQKYNVESCIESTIRKLSLLL